MLKISDCKSLQPRKRIRKHRRVERKWDDVDTWKLIQLVKNMSHIWNPTDEYYKDGRKRKSSFEKIAMSLNRTRTDCKAKWDNLKVQHRNQFIKGKRREDGEHNYEVKWKYYPALYFLNSSCKPPNPKQNCSVKITSNPEEFENSWSSNTMPFTCEEEDSSSFKPCINELEKEELIPTPSPVLNTKSDSSQIFGDFVADRLRHLTHKNTELVKNKILKILLDASTAEK